MTKNTPKPDIATNNDPNIDRVTPAEALEKLQSIDLEKITPKIWEWVDVNILNVNTLHQIIILCISFAFSTFLFRTFKDNIRNLVDQIQTTPRNHRILRSLTKLLFPAISLLTIFFVTRIAASDLVGVDVWLIHGMIKVLFAWICIRIGVQIIENALVRNLFSIVIWSLAALSIFGVLDQTMDILDSFAFELGAFHISLLSLIKGAFFLFTLIYFASFLSSIFEKKIAKSRNLSKSSQVLLTKIIRAVLIIIALLLGITSSGIDLSLFAVFGGAIGLGIGFGLQKGIANLFSGMLLLLDRSIQPGDIIELENGTFGVIEHMAARYTEVLTLDNKSILIPNEELISKSVINWSHGDSLIRVAVTFGAHYDSNPHDVIRIASEAVLSVPRAVKNKKDNVSCFLTEFADSSLNFMLIFWIADPENGIANVKGQILLALWDAFKKNNIQIPYPHREVYMHNVEEKL